MLLAYIYKLNPSPSQTALLEPWLNLLCLQYNFRLRERIEANAQARAPKLGNYCDLESKAESRPLDRSVSKNALYGELWTGIEHRAPPNHRLVFID